MLITQKQARAIRRKIGDKQLKQYEVAKELGVSPSTIPKIVSGKYEAPRRIYQSVMEWLIE